MANVKMSEAARNAALTALSSLLDGGGTLNIYTGSRPATPETTASGTLLASLALSSAAFGAASGASIPANSIIDAAILATDTAGYCRLADSAGVGVIDGDVGVVSSGAFIELSSLSLVATVTLSATSLTLNIPIGS